MTKPSNTRLSHREANPKSIVPVAGPDPQRLHEATDRLNTVLVDFEDALRQLKLGVSATVTLEETPEGWIRVLSFSKTSSGFRLVVESGVEGDESTFNVTPITSASRETRLQAVDQLPALYQNLLTAFEAEINRVNSGIVRTETLARAVRALSQK